MLVTYVAKGESSLPVSAGSGVFLGIGATRFILTCSHVLARFQALYAADTTAVVQAPVKPMRDKDDLFEAIECYDRYVLQSKSELPTVEDGVEIWYGFRDLALIRVRSNDLKFVEQHKKILTLAIEPAGISGSAIYDDHELSVGLVFGGSKESRRIHACPGTAPVVRAFIAFHKASWSPRTDCE